MARKAIKPIYVLKGSDALLLDAARAEIISAVVGDADPQVCVSRYDGDVELATVLDELRTLPFLAPRRVVIVSPADAFIVAHRERLESYLESPSTRSALVLVTATWKSNTRLGKAVARVGEVADCSLPGRGSLGRWISAAAERRGKKISRQASELLEQLVERDCATLDSEIEKLSLFVGSRGRIEAADVSAVAAASAGPAAFALTNAITAGDPAAALEALGDLLTIRGAEFMVLGQVTWHLRRALAAAERLRGGPRPADAVPPMPPAQRSAFLAMLRRRDVTSFRGDFRRLLAADLAMKTGADPVATLQELVIHLCHAPAEAVSSRQDC